ncbi:MAG: ABC transporter permease [Pelobium sp.]
MIKNYFKIAWRNLVNRKFYAFINIFGLALGITSAVMLYLFISFHLSFDTYHKNASKTYRVVNELFFDKVLYEKGASIGMYEALSSDVATIKDANVMLSDYTFTVTVNDGLNKDKRFKETKNVALVSPDWFKMFDYQWLSGNPEVIDNPNVAVITQSQARKYFGDENPIGKTLIFENTQPVKVVGLLSDAPANSDLKSGIFLSLSSLKNIQPDIWAGFYKDWGWTNSTTSLYLTLNDQKSKAQVETTIANMAKVRLGEGAKYYHFSLQPLSDVHFDSKYGGEVQKSLLLTLGLIGVLILIIASINYINISIAQQAKRMVEIGTRKVLGGTAGQLFTQFMVETILTIMLAFLLSIVFIILLLPLANQILFSQQPIGVVSYQEVILFLSFMLFALILASGIYPAFVLSRIQIFTALKNKVGTWKAGLVRKSLIVFQNTVAYLLIICTFIIVLQVNYLKHTDLGFNRDAVVMVPIPDTTQQKENFLKDKLAAIPQVTSSSFCYAAPSSRNDRGGSFKYDQRDWEKWVGRSAVGDSAYVKTFGLQLIAGRNLKGDTSSREYLVNETLIHKLGIKNPNEVIGKPLAAGEFDDVMGTIVGVVKDFNTKSLEVPIEPSVIVNMPDRFSNIGVKLNGADLQKSMHSIQKAWETTYPDQVFEYQFLDDQIAALYQKQDLQQKITWVAASIAIIISCLGLLGLVSLMILQRTKEIGVRKVLGASVAVILQLLSTSFLRLIFISLLIAAPLSYWLMNNWLQNFSYRIEISWWIFAVAGMLSILIAFLTISFQTIKAALANPIKSLRME